MKQALKAVLIILRHQEEILVIKRQSHLKAFPGYTTFAGGKVEKEDHLTSSYQNISDENYGAICRELHEELGIDLQKLHLESKIIDIKHIANATTPDFNPIRFESLFYLIDLIEKPDLRLCEAEVELAYWKTPQELLASFQRGEYFSIPFFRTLLVALMKQEHHFLEREQFLEEEVPWVSYLQDLVQIMPLSNTVPPATRTNAFVVGKVLIDPSPKNDEELAKFEKTLKHFAIDKIMLTHHHGDHHQYSNYLAKKFAWPVFMSHQTKEMLLEKDLHYFDGIETQILSEGDKLTSWLGEDVVIYHIPGHDCGHLGLAPKSLRWFIVGDLFQGIGTVVIGPKEGNMSDYFKTLERVIHLAPDCVIPSHGIPLGKTDILEKTLEHRKLREEQILQFYQQGVSVDEMLKKIYFDIPEKILKYARANIGSHLRKLRDEGKIT